IHAKAADRSADSPLGQAPPAGLLYAADPAGGARSPWKSPYAGDVRVHEGSPDRRGGGVPRRAGPSVARVSRPDAPDRADVRPSRKELRVFRVRHVPLP